MRGGAGCDGQTLYMVFSAMTLRRKAREAALQILYQMEVQKISPEESVESYWMTQHARREIVDFSKRLVLGVTSTTTEIDELIGRHAANWKLERIALIDRNILRIAIYEFIREEETPFPVVINESVEIAKKFSSKESFQFINGILDSVKEELILSGRRGESRSSRGEETSNK